MKITKSDTRLFPCPTRNRLILSCLVAAVIAAGPALQARAQETNLELNPDAVPKNTVIATVTLSGTPGDMVVNPTDTFVYVTTLINSSNSYVISQIDATTHAVINTFPIGSDLANGLAITPNGKQLYVGIETSTPPAVEILDASTGAVINTVPLTAEPGLPQITPDGKFAYIPTGPEVVVIDTAIQKVKHTIPIPISSTAGAESVVFNRSGTLAYVTILSLTAPPPGILAQIDTATLKVTHKVVLNQLAFISILNPATKDVWTPTAANLSTGGFDAIDIIQGRKVIKTVRPPTGAVLGIPAFTPNGTYAYVPEFLVNGSAGNSVYLMNTISYKVVGSPIQVGNEPNDVQIAHNGKFAYVTNVKDDTVSIIQISPAQ